MAGKKRHHAAASSSKKNKKKNPVVDDEIDEQDLDRFAGSSDEDEDEDAPNQPTFAKQQSPSTEPPSTNNAEEVDDEVDDDDDDKEDDDDDDDDSSGDDDFDHYDKQQRQKQNGAAGMADAMAKILGSAAGNKPSVAATQVVLSKTVTPLQKQLRQEKEAAKALSDKRRSRGAFNNGNHPLPSLHMPLSVATTSSSFTTQSSSVAKELEQERVHRRVATRGVVALFNAVAQHQQQSKQQQQQKTTLAENSSKDMKKKMTKHGFLDMIKTAAVANTSTTSTTNTPEDGHPKQDKVKKSTSKWAAVQDDYLLNPKKVRAFVVTAVW
jgi:Rrp15p